MRCETATIWTRIYMGQEKGFPNCDVLWVIAPLAKLERYFTVCYRSHVGYGSRHEIFTGRLLWHATGGDQGVAKLSSLQRG